MSVTPDKIRELASDQEGTRLDYKKSQYDWNTTKGNNELAKDLMAMANSLSPNAGNGYILIGVEEIKETSGRITGKIVGVQPATHLNDSDMHQKVLTLLNRTPDFSYEAVEVDGFSIGVFEIRPGGRPYFPVRDAPPLIEGVAKHRDGSSTATSRPTRIVEWYQEDHVNEHRTAEIEALKVQTTPRAILANRSISGHDWHFYIENASLIPFTIFSIQAIVHPVPILWTENGAEVPDERPVFSANVGPFTRQSFEPGSKGNSVQIVYDPRAITESIFPEKKDVEYLDSWFDMYVIVEIVGPTGEHQTHSEH